MKERSRITPAMVAASHQEQFKGRDYQQVAWDIVQGLDFTPTEDEAAQLESSPDPGCDCLFCRTAQWETPNLLRVSPL